MYTYEKEILKRIAEKLKDRFQERIVSVHAFGSRVRGDHDEWSDFDVLVVVRERDPKIETEIISIIVDEETKSGLSFSPYKTAINRSYYSVLNAARAILILEGANPETHEGVVTMLSLRFIKIGILEVLSISV
ncbi:MAG: nucleotidyltransferase domain-containing protein [Desulfobacterales bacterium]|nr:nucleotidyltransferase domain-containing protein [Desulfobacterales bacterium]